MTEIKISLPLTAVPEDSAPPKPNGKTVPKRRGLPLHQIYSLPVPIRTFPLPAFYPNNPISIIHVAYAWLKQTVRPPPAEPSIVYHGVWSEGTNSVHITDETFMRGLWEQGFFGKGSLSRSEPSWLRRELVRKGLEATHVSEIHTTQRRQERADAKWERAKLEQEAIRQTKLSETQTVAVAADAVTKIKPPVGPAELLALPNSMSEIKVARPKLATTSILVNGDYMAPPSELSLMEKLAGITTETGINGSTTTPQTPASRSRGSSTNSRDGSEKPQKSVRFSPQVESTTFEFSDPPSSKTTPDGRAELTTPHDDDSPVTATESPKDTLVNKEHLQLTPEEAFFLNFGLGALSITDPYSGLDMSTMELLRLFREHSYSPPRNGPDADDLQPDDSFLVHYVVYHHFRSLGWVPRAGIKFGVDWLLYARGPVFDHAEFGLIIVPSYSHSWWKAHWKRAETKSWAWLHSVVRVLSHVTKSLVLVYVDVPPPPIFDAAITAGLTDALKLYKVREIMVKRWAANRNR
ncbi:tRNA-splicing endonuclease subunit Sen2, putative [Cordyceps militaris CM01]|uniref:tRNA-intron lyase n=1 Tax=Cordyceps militaris (strain CM01) TaxID=983644 RepID=G3JUC5_CORMM|nr:tRNA-splicing endonuclease subunit Sen2, putative [Cordyceps militaris CM01]EGX87899.1 tRNA-splicing endonuclease subunit Sen2, putative [Cordyceps militaris CM01]